MGLQLVVLRALARQDLMISFKTAPDQKVCGLREQFTLAGLPSFGLRGEAAVIGLAFDPASVDWLTSWFAVRVAGIGGTFVVFNLGIRFAEFVISMPRLL